MHAVTSWNDQKLSAMFYIYVIVFLVITGMISICCGCDKVYAWGAAAIGALAGPFMMLCSKLVVKCGIDDPLDAFAVHAGGTSYCWVNMQEAHSSVGLPCMTQQVTRGHNIINIVANGWKAVYNLNPHPRPPHTQSHTPTTQNGSIKKARFRIFQLGH